MGNWLFLCALCVVARVAAGAIAPRRRVGPEDYIGPVVVVSVVDNVNVCCVEYT